MTVKHEAGNKQKQAKRCLDIRSRMKITGRDKMYNDRIRFSEKCKEISDNFHIKPNIPEEKLKNAAKSMSVGIFYVEAIFDNTVFGGASDGFVITRTKCVFKALWADPIHINYAEIDKISYEKNGKKESMLIHKTDGECVQIDDLLNCDYKKLVELFEELVENCEPQTGDENTLWLERARKINKENEEAKKKRDQAQEKQKSEQEKTQKKLPIAPDEYVVAVVAPMSSGKSTTLNAMLGVPLLPTKNQACTAITTKITDIDGLTKFHARTIQQDGRASGWQSLSVGSSQLSEWNDSSFEAIEIQGDFPHIENHTHRMVFLDTPGPNNSSDQKHAEITHTLLSKSGYSFLVFVFDASQSRTDDEEALLQKVSAELKGNTDHSRIVFIMNKADELKFHRGERLEDYVAETRKYLEKNGFKTPEVIPVMSKLSLEIRMCLEAYKARTGLPFDALAQEDIADEIECVLELMAQYKESFSKICDFDQYEDRSKNNNQHYAGILQDRMVIGGQEFDVQQLIAVDLITGIPILEYKLETALKLFSSSN